MLRGSHETLLHIKCRGREEANEKRERIKKNATTNFAGLKWTFSHARCIHFSFLFLCLQWTHSITARKCFLHDESSTTLQLIKLLRKMFWILLPSSGGKVRPFRCAHWHRHWHQIFPFQCTAVIIGINYNPMTGPENWRRCNAVTEHQVKRRVHQRQVFNSIQIQNTRGIYAANVWWMCRCTYNNLPICCLPCVCVWTVGKGMYLNSRAWRVNDFLIIIISLRTFRRCRYLVLVCTTVYVFTFFFARVVWDE